MKKYYIRQPRNFNNEYDLRWAEKDSAEEESLIAAGYERITRKQAIDKCVTERWTRKHDTAFSGYGSTIILPAESELTEGEAMEVMTTSDGYVYK